MVCFMFTGQFRTVLVVSLFMLFLNSYKFSSKANTINISPSGKDTSDCGIASNPCQSLDFVFSTFYDHLNGTVLQLNGNLSLNESHRLKNLHNFGIVGKRLSTEKIEIQCKGNASLAFENSNRINLEAFTLRGCGGDWYDTRPKQNKTGITVPVALYFNFCSDIKLLSIDVLESHGRAVIMLDIASKVTFEDCVFADNAPRHDIKEHPGNKSCLQVGGGVFLKLTKKGDNTQRISSQNHVSHNNNNHYIFINCTFQNNQVHSFSVKNDSNCSIPKTLDQGGGLGISFEGNASHNIIEISFCTFTGNKAQHGGGLYVQFRHFSQNNTLRIGRCTFEQNVAGTEGGGACLGTNNPKLTKILIPHNFTVYDCSFENNTSVWGGGLSIFGATRRTGTGVHNAKLNFVLIRNCQWFRNKGTVGSAIAAFLSNLNEDEIGPSVPYYLRLEDCTIGYNKVTVPKSRLIIGQGAVFSVMVPITLRGKTIFANNTNSALALDSATVEINDNVSFTNNTGIRGGGVCMYGSSKFVLMKKSKLVFQGNKFTENGGALYVSAPGTPFVSISVTDGGIHKCFFVYEVPERDFNDWETEVVFRGNQAPSVFATTLMNCDRASEKRGANQALEWKFVKFLDVDGNKVKVSDEVSTDPFNITYSRSDWNVAPGEVFSPTINLVNEKGKVVDGTVHVEVHGSSSTSTVTLGGSSRGTFQSTSLNTSRNTSYVSNMSIDGKEGESYHVTLKSLNGPLVYVHINNLRLTNCKDGFKWDTDINRCRCIGRGVEPGISRCNKARTKVFIRKGYWAGVVGENKTFHTSPCPSDYCDCPYDDETKGYECLYQRGNMCNSSRNGSSILCGQCKNDRTVVLGSSVCSESCSDWWLFILLAYGAAILILVIVIMAINVDAFTGYLNCWLYFYQVLPYLIKGGNQNPFIGFLKFVIALSNLQVHIGDSGICLAKGLDDADKLMLECAVPVFALVVVFILATFVKRFPGWFYSRRKTNPLRALCTIFVLCYTTITSISIKLLHFVKIGDKYYLYQDGFLEFFKTTKHIIYGSWAIFCILVVVIPVPAFLMFTPFCTKRVPRRVGNLMPFYDPLQSCFKNQYRCFSAFYFVCRLVLLLIAVWAPESLLKRAFLDTACVVFLGFFLYFRPYKEPNPRAENDPQDEQEDEQPHQCCSSCVINTDNQDNNYDWINTSDAILLTTLCVISVFSSQVPEYAGENVDGKTVIAILNVLACIPLLVLVFVILRALYVRHANKNMCPTCTVATDSPEQTPVPSDSTTNKSSEQASVPSDTTTSATSTRSSEHTPIITGTAKSYGSNDTTPSDLGSNAYSGTKRKVVIDIHRVADNIYQTTE